MPALPVPASLLRNALFSAMVIVRAIAGEPSPVDSFPFVPPLPVIASHAARAEIPLTGFDAVAGPSRNNSGDTVVALISISEGASIRQWLLELKMVPLTAEEEGRTKPRSSVIYLSTGSQVSFEASNLALAMRLIGPARSDERNGANARLAEAKARALVQAGFLGLGFDRAAAAMVRLAALEDKGMVLNLGISDGAFPADVVAKTKPIADAAGLTADEERAFAGIAPALFAFFDVVQKTPGLKEILSEMLDKVSVGWSFLTHGGNLNPSFGFGGEEIGRIDASRWSAALPPTYAFPVSVVAREWRDHRIAGAESAQPEAATLHSRDRRPPRRRKSLC